MTLNAVLALASHTGWPLSDIDAMSGSELLEWCDHLPKPKR